MPDTLLPRAKPYQADSAAVIELKLRDLTQLFNSMDPSPFHEKDLDHDAEEFIVSWAQEHPSQQPLLLRVHLEQWPSQDPVETIRQAVHHYFSYRAGLGRRELRHLMKQARVSLVIGVLFLSLCLVAAQGVGAYSHSVWTGLVKEGLTIVGWVAMWKPIQMYLYDWWPVSQQIGIYQKLSQVPIEVAGKG